MTDLHHTEDLNYANLSCALFLQENLNLNQ